MFVAGAASNADRTRAVATSRTKRLSSSMALLIEAWNSPESWPNAAAASSALSPTMARSEEHTSELQSLMRISYAVFCLKKKNTMATRYIINNTYERETTYITLH